MELYPSGRLKVGNGYRAEPGHLRGLVFPVSRTDLHFKWKTDCIRMYTQIQNGGRTKMNQGCRSSGELAVELWGERRPTLRDKLSNKVQEPSGVRKERQKKRGSVTRVSDKRGRV